MSICRTVSLLVMLGLLWTLAGTAQESVEAINPSADILRDKYILGLSEALKTDD